MVTIGPNTKSVPPPELESAGRIGGDGDEVLCSVVLAEESDTGETIGIIPGCGGTAEHYAGLQIELARRGINSVYGDTVQNLSLHQNRLQAQAAEQTLIHVRDKYDLEVANAYGHSWGGAKLASLLNHGVPSIRMGVFHSTSGIESALRNIARHPIKTAAHVADELLEARRHGSDENDHPKFRLPALSIGKLAVLAQQALVASEHRKLPEHLGRVPKVGVLLVGLWADRDPLFEKKHHEIFHINRVMEGSVHTEPQSNPSGVADELASLVELRRANDMAS